MNCSWLVSAVLLRTLCGRVLICLKLAGTFFTKNILYMLRNKGSLRVYCQIKGSSACKMVVLKVPQNKRFHLKRKGLILLCWNTLQLNQYRILRLTLRLQAVMSFIRRSLLDLVCWIMIRHADTGELQQVLTGAWNRLWDFIQLHTQTVIYSYSVSLSCISVFILYVYYRDYTYILINFIFVSVSLQELFSLI